MSQRWWRFSLREIMLLCTTICCVLALVVRTVTQQSAPTAFFQAVNEQQLIQSAAKKIGIHASSFGGGGGFSCSPRRANKEYEYTIVITSPGQAGKLGFHLRESVAGLLAKNGCRVVGTSTQGNLKLKEVPSFGFDYEKSDLQGSIRVDCDVRSESLCRISFSILECAP